jgi:hypothetical protein
MTLSDGELVNQLSSITNNYKREGRVKSALSFFKRDEEMTNENQEIKKTRKTVESVSGQEVLLSVGKPEVYEAPTTQTNFASKAGNNVTIEGLDKPLSENAILSKAKKEGKLTEREIAYLKAIDLENVRGIFHFWECKGGILKFDLMKYKNTKPDWEMVDGQIYTVPFYVAKHLNTTGFIEEEKTIQDPITLQYRKLKQKRRRYSFESLEFLPPEVIGTSTEYEGLVTPDNSIIL